ncbi:phenoloxidase-activating factor 2-like isoform X2 [Coccinella septempunctata]|nr:phenoloxidase-activating factor 2-like isoform X2 [Coccinella septempunctata]XP_044761125.1 phenoloxidase-activating factor 2-like isoform X2 [Coccinella septempunctata]
MDIMKTFSICLSLLFVVKAQIARPNNTVIQAVNDIFNDTFYEEVTEEALRGYGALHKCGENERQGIDVCVPYYNCDPTTKTVIQTGEFDGFNSINIRNFAFGSSLKNGLYDDGENQCDHYLDVCCQVRPNSTSTFSSTTQGSILTHSSTREAFTSPSISSTERITRTKPTATTRKPTSTGNRPDEFTLNEKADDDWTECGVRNVNGIDFTLQGNLHNEAQYGEFPWQVALLRTNYDKSIHGHQCICGGSLIRPNVVLTAAHCLTILQPSEITVRAGEWDTQTTKERIPFQERLAIKTITHEKYGDGAINDIGIVVLNEPFTKVKSIGLVCLPKANQKVDSQHCIASGWGKNNFGREGAYSVILKKIELPIVSNDKCQNLLRKTRLGPLFKLHNSFTCAGGEAGKDTCTGDGGSPLVCPDQDNPRRYIQSGIVSWGVGCGQKDVPGVYTDVVKMINWVERKLREINT